MADAITSFGGSYRFLSNFFPSQVRLDGVIWPTVEHAYQAAKFPPDSPERNYVMRCETPGAAKRVGRRFRMMPDFDSRRFDIMLDLVGQKFEDPALRRLLLDTGNRDIIEGNTWGDTYWGVCNGQGLNRLGEILKRVRSACLLIEMAGVYPGDPDGSMAREAAELLGREYTPPQVTVTFEDDL